MRKAGFGRGTWIAAIAATLAQPALSQTSVTLYGAVDDALTYVNNQKGHSNVYMRQGNLYASKFGLLGKEDLGGGTTALFDLQNGFDLNSGALQSSGLLFNRQAYVGLRNVTAGTITLGRQYTPYYLFVGPLTGSNWLTGATGAHPGDIDGLDTTVRINSSVTYTSPVWYGLQASAMYAFGGVAGRMGSGQSWSAALRYSAGAAQLSVGYLRMGNAQGTSGFDASSSGSFGSSALNAGYISARAIQHVAVAGNYTFANFTLGASYSNVEYLAGGKSVFGSTAVFNTWALLGVYRVSPFFDVAGGYAYTAASKANGISDAARYHQLSLRETYHLSKRTSLYALQAWQHASGQTLGPNGAGNVIDAAPAVGDSQNATPSSTRSQFVGMAGIAMLF